MDVDLQNPEITINIDRERALREGISTAQIGMEIRAAVFGKEASKLKDGEDEYKIQVRYNQLERNNISDLMNMRLDRKSGSAGMPRPISYAVFCLKKKRPSEPSRHQPCTGCGGIENGC
eukprot:TRINITY_DN31947_c0_g1_i1.p3 TRINITY_DN31947_c0_g1~~TRINITY_DN31947_c0_g1_i1.p3  ORF type:complete len:119 (-),score=18.97 TRINITY_DN31947_c0_g1_i1:366-722(-)